MIVVDRAVTANLSKLETARGVVCSKGSGILLHERAAARSKLATRWWRYAMDGYAEKAVEG
jgi:hypothetical protein